MEVNIYDCLNLNDEFDFGSSLKVEPYADETYLSTESRFSQDIDSMDEQRYK